MGEHERADAVARRCLGRLGHRRVVVEDVLETLHGDQLHEVVANHGLDVCGGVVAQVVEPGTRHTVAAQDDGTIGDLHSERNGGLDRPMIGGGDANEGRPHHELVAGIHFDRRHHRPLGQVLVVIDPVANIGGERGQRVFHHVADAGRTDDRERERHRAHHPARGDHVAEVGDVIAVEVGDQQPVEHGWQHSCCNEPHQHATTAVDQHREAICGHERGGTCPSSIGNRATGTEQRHAHVSPPSLSWAGLRTPSRSNRRLGR